MKKKLGEKEPYEKSGPEWSGFETIVMRRAA